ncbi:MAG TPA: peptidoglycan-binding protein [Rhizobium sp.]|nr:peptidoglycan-binding protein [Rhizobium sp.]
MMKNRAGLLALLVLGIATILMVFFVMPRISTDKNEAGETTTATGETVKDTTSDAATAASQKMDRLAADAVKAVQSLDALFADGKTPNTEAYSGARAQAETAVSAISGIEIPDTLEDGPKATMTKARENAARALALIKSLPADPAAAASLIGRIADALAGKQDTGASPTPTDGQAAAASALPRFDILRVEPDGSTVIAGKAEPGAKLEIVDGDKVIASFDVGNSGDFAAVLDSPLTPGDHSIELRVTGKDGKAVTSEEVATVSVPEDGSGNLLAMVTKPGEATRVITAPETINSADKRSRVAAETSALTPELPTQSQQLSTSAPVVGTEPTTAEPAPPAPGAAEVQVTAVEIEGDRIFVAGTALPGRQIRAYADDALIGSASADTIGHFVVEGTLSLSVGNHMIRADMLDASGNVAVRASVPFNRPEGDQVAVVAQSPKTASGQGGAMVPIDYATFEKLRGSLGKAFAILQTLYADGKKPALEELAAARSATEIGLKSIADFRLGSDSNPAIGDFVAETTANAGKALEALQALPNETDAVGSALPEIAKLIDAVLKPLPPELLAGIQAPPAPATEGAVSATDAPASVETASQQPKTIEQAPLAESRNSVIIRRGDTLWQISRRVYGKGVRYTTIYLANANKIGNPDLIEPGQIFSVPQEALPNAEELHRKRLQGEQIN